MDPIRSLTPHIRTRFVFLNVEASKVMVLQEKIKKAMPKIMDRITDNFNLGNGTKVNVA